MTTKYNLSRLIARTIDIPVKDPITQELVTTITILPSDDPKIMTLLAEVLGSMPKFPTDSGSIGDVVAYNNADKTANRKIVIARIVKTDHPDLQTPEAIAEFFNHVRYEVIESILEDGADRAQYFR